VTAEWKNTTANGWTGSAGDRSERLVNSGLNLVEGTTAAALRRHRSSIVFGRLKIAVLFREYWNIGEGTIPVKLDSGAGNFQHVFE
jgi:hypothetical protein